MRFRLIILLLFPFVNLSGQSENQKSKDYYYIDFELTEKLILTKDSFSYSHSIGLIYFRVSGTWKEIGDTIYLQLNQNYPSSKLEVNKKIYQDLKKNNKFLKSKFDLIQLDEKDKPRKVNYVILNNEKIKTSKSKHIKRFVQKYDTQQ